MHAADLRFELSWKRQLENLQETVHFTTVHKPSSSNFVVASKTGPVALTSNSGLGASSSAVTEAVPLSYAQVRCPAHVPLSAEAAALASCVGEITPYYLVSSSDWFLCFEEPASPHWSPVGQPIKPSDY